MVTENVNLHALKINANACFIYLYPLWADRIAEARVVDESQLTIPAGGGSTERRTLSVIRWLQVILCGRVYPQAYAMAKAVGSPSVKILFDVYHVQIQEGNLIPTMDYAWDEIAYIQVGDTPGRNEPGTGEINYKNVLQHIHDKGYRGFVGMEHGISGEGKAGDLAALEAYRVVDPE